MIRSKMDFEKSSISQFRITALSCAVWPKVVHFFRNFQVVDLCVLLCLRGVLGWFYGVLGRLERVIRDESAKNWISEKS